VRLALDQGNVHFPHVDLTPVLPKPGQRDDCGGGLQFLERTRVKTRLGCCEGVLTLEKGSSFDCLPEARVGEVTVKGGDVVLIGGERYVDVREDVAVVRMAKQAGQRYALAAQVTMPGSASGKGYLLSVAQQDEAGRTVGGASAWLTVGA
jgi:hypothetical protein